MQGLKSIKAATTRLAGTAGDSSPMDQYRHILQQPKPTLASYVEFWRSIETPANANAFLTALAKHLTDSRGRGVDALGVSNGSVLATMLLLVLYAPVSAEGKSGVGQWLKGKSAKGDRASTGTSDERLTYEAVTAMVGKADSMAELALMVQRCSDVHPVGGPGVGEDVGEDVTEGGEIATAWLFDFMRRKLQVNHGVAPILSTLRGLLSLGPTLTPTPKALALLHMLTELLLCCHAFTNEELQRVEKEVRGYCMWAQPVGHAAGRVLHCLRAELAMRGASMFQLLAREAPWLRYPYAQTAAARRALGENMVVHVALDESVDWARAFRVLMMARSTPHEEDEAARHALCSMLYALFKGAAFGVSTAKLQMLTYPQILDLTSTATVLACELGEPRSATAAAADAANCVEGLRKLAEKVGQLAGGSQRSLAADDTQGDVRTPRLPPLSLRPLDPLLASPSATASMSAASSSTPSAASLREAELREAAEQCAGKRYQFDPLLSALHERGLEQAGRLTSLTADLVPPLRIAVAGGDSLLHRLLQAYVVLRCAFPPAYAASMQFYLVPLGRTNRLAAFLAAHDGWYRRHIYAPHAAGQPTVPHLLVPPAPPTTRSASDEAAESSLEGAMGSVTVGGASAASTTTKPLIAEATLRASLTEFFRSAQATLPLVIYEVACWLTLPGGYESPAASATGGVLPSTKFPTEAPFITIAFCQSVEVVGLPTSPSGAVDLTASAREANAALTATVTYTMSDPWGVSYSTPCAITGRFSSLSYHAYSIESAHSPSSGRLQMRSAMASDKGRSGAATRAPSRYVRTATVGVGNPAVGESMTPRSVRAGAVTQATEKFGLYVDGEYYGPFACATISPCVAPGDSEPLKLPLQTFFPLQGQLD